MVEFSSSAPFPPREYCLGVFPEFPSRFWPACMVLQNGIRLKSSLHRGPNSLTGSTAGN